LASAAIFVKMGVLQIGISAMVIENKVVTVMSSSPHSTIVPSDSDTEDAFSSMNILNYFPASPGNISPNSSDDFTKELGHEHNFVTEMVVRRANVDVYAETGLLWSLPVFIRSTVIWERVHDFLLGVESYQQHDNLTALTITFPGIKNYKMFSIISEPGSRFRRFLDNKLKDEERMWRSIQKGPYVRPMITDPDDTTQQEMWERIKRLMYGSEVTNHVRHSRLMDEFDKFAAKEGESLESVYERLTTLVNIMDRNNVRPISVSINTKFLNCLQPEWSKYVTMVRHNQTGHTVSYEQFYDSLLQFKPHIQASKAKRATRNHDPLALIAHSNASSQSHARYGGNGNRNAGRQNRNQAFNVGNMNDKSNQIVQRIPRTESNPGKENVQCYNCNEKGHYARDCQKPRVRDAKYFREQMLLAMKDEAESNLNTEENDFMLDNSFGDETLEELTAAVIMMARIQPADDNALTEPTYDAKAISEVNVSHKAHEQVNHVKRKTIIHASDDDQIDSNIIFDDPYVENNGGTSEHDSNDHDEYHNIQILAYNLEREIRADKDTIERILKEKDKIKSDFFKIENEKIIIQHETQLAKKAFKERENRYLEDIVDLEEKLSSHDRIIYKIGQSIQTIHMLGKTPNKVYDPFLKAGLGYQNPKRLKKAIAAQQKMYYGEMLYNTKLKIDLPNSKETLEDAEESRLKMRNKMVQLNYGKLNALYETFVPQKEPFVEQTYFSFSTTSNECSKSNEVMLDLQIPKMAKESKLLKMFEKIGLVIGDLRKRINFTLLEDTQRRWMSDSQNSLREFIKLM
ncbi:putative ribonuclease H-like domain-containing protein, partial [Tanacetum coccineum]